MHGTLGPGFFLIVGKPRWEMKISWLQGFCPGRFRSTAPAGEIS
jgi:hypothetical protein